MATEQSPDHVDLILKHGVLEVVVEISGVGSTVEESLENGNIASVDGVAEDAVQILLVGVRSEKAHNLGAALRCGSEEDIASIASVMSECDGIPRPRILSSEKVDVGPQRQQGLDDIDGSVRIDDGSQHCVDFLVAIDLPVAKPKRGAKTTKCFAVIQELSLGAEETSCLVDAVLHLGRGVCCWHRVQMTTTTPLGEANDEKATCTNRVATDVCPPTGGLAILTSRGRIVSPSPTKLSGACHWIFGTINNKWKQWPACGLQTAIVSQLETRRGGGGGRMRETEARLCAKTVESGGGLGPRGRSVISMRPWWLQSGCLGRAGHRQGGQDSDQGSRSSRVVGRVLAPSCIDSRRASPNGECCRPESHKATNCYTSATG